MALSKIEWTDYTWNFWIGCTKKSEACTFCYADTQDQFRHWTPEGWGKGKPRRRTSENYWTTSKSCTPKSCWARINPKYFLTAWQISLILKYRTNGEPTPWRLSAKRQTFNLCC